MEQEKADLQLRSKNYSSSFNQNPQRRAESRFGSALLIFRIKIAADLSDSVKYKRPIHSPLFYRGVFHFIGRALPTFNGCYPLKVVNHS